MQVDHINGDGTDNAMQNLRLVTPSGNKRNIRLMKSNKTGVTGVCNPTKAGSYAAHAHGWRDGKKVHLGQSRNFDVAVALRRVWEAQGSYHANHGTDRAL